jgi:hypothetical protein
VAKGTPQAEDMQIPKLDYSAAFTSNFADFAGIQSAGFRFIWQSLP